MLSPLVPHIVASIDSARSKPLLRGDGAFALATLSNLALTDSSASSALRAIPGAVFKGDSFMFELLDAFPSKYIFCLKFSQLPQLTCSLAMRPEPVFSPQKAYYSIPLLLLIYRTAVRSYTPQYRLQYVTSNQPFEI